MLWKTFVSSNHILYVDFIYKQFYQAWFFKAFLQIVFKNLSKVLLVGEMFWTEVTSEEKHNLF